MRIDDIALGVTYRLQAPEVDNPDVVVETITFCHQGQYGRMADIVLRPTDQGHRLHYLVEVYEAARDVRYPCDPRHLQPLR